MRMPSIPKPAPKPTAEPASPRPVEAKAEPEKPAPPAKAEKVPAAATPAPVAKTAKPKAKRRRTQAPKAAPVALPKPGPALAKPKVKMTVYLSQKTRQTADAAIKARIQQFKMEYRSLSSVVIAALEWFLDEVVEESPAFPVERLERHLAGESPYNAPIGLWMEEDLKRKYNLIPSGMRAELCDVIVATWMARVLPGT